MLKSLVENAFDFLDRAIADFDRSPKYSVINYYSAIELFLKARLLAEHWTLVVAPNSSLDVDKFKSGEFQSITLAQAAERLSGVLKSPLTSDEISLFKKLGSHRNRMVHFFHEATTPGGSKKVREEIAREQLRSWHLLHCLLKEKWCPIFEAWYSRIDGYFPKLKKHKEFLNAVFEGLEQEIKIKSAKGIVFDECPSCGHKAAEVIPVLGGLVRRTCLVCQHRDSLLNVSCPSCGEPMTFENEGFGSCPNCEEEFDPEMLVKALDEGEASLPGDPDSDRIAHCTSCERVRSVIEYEGRYLCLGCLELFDEIGTCGWCGDWNAGDMENSYLEGCVLCEGRFGHERDDD